MHIIKNILKIQVNTDLGEKKRGGGGTNKNIERYSNS